MVCSTKSTWSCYTCLYLSWQICSPLVASPRVWWHCWEDLDDYRLITLLNTELKILAWFLANCLQFVISNLIEPEQNYAVKGRLIQDNLHLVHKVLEGLKDGTKAILTNLDQSKVFNRSSTNGLPWCTTTSRQWCSWTGSIQRLLRLSDQSIIVATISSSL